MSDANQLARAITLTEVRQGLDFEEAVYAVVNGLRGSDDQKADLYAFIVENTPSNHTLAALEAVCYGALGVALYRGEAYAALTWPTT